MKVKAVKTFWHNHKKISAGDVVVLSKDEAKKYIFFQMVKEEKEVKKTKEQK
tara:strand:+ start:1788 stop:1943 length:156 start_codon:yes stop_codon:yes gene_type:complete